MTRKVEKVSFCEPRLLFVFSRAFLVFSSAHFVVWLYAFGRGLMIHETPEVLWWREIAVLLAQPLLPFQKDWGTHPPLVCVPISSALNGMALAVVCLLIVCLASAIHWCAAQVINWFMASRRTAG